MNIFSIKIYIIIKKKFEVHFFALKNFRGVFIVDFLSFKVFILDLQCLILYLFIYFILILPSISVSNLTIRSPFMINYFVKY